MTREAVLVVLILTAPWVLVLVVAMVRGYDMTLTLSRRKRPPQ